MAKRIRTTLGGDRLGSGNRNKIEMHNYYRSNHNLSCSRISSMAPGVLYPMYVNVGLTGDTFDFDLNAFIRTLPTEGPMFGAFKLQVDVFSADMRLYQAILHNNTTEIGYHMDQVLLPKIELETDAKKGTKLGQFSNSSLMKYLGISGIGQPDSGQEHITRKFNAVPVLAYYDIFKNYYANKQEKNAYVINSGSYFKSITAKSRFNSVEGFDSTATLSTPDLANWLYITPNAYIRIYGDQMTQNGVNFNILFSTTANGTFTSNLPTNFVATRKTDSFVEIEYIGTTSGVSLYIKTNSTTYRKYYDPEKIELTPFPLSNIDDMRKECLTLWDLGEELVIDNGGAYLPYSTLTGTKEQPIGNLSKNCNPMQGLVVKCYQSDWFNNWLDSEFLEEIAQRSNVNVIGGSFSIDALNFAKKLYDHYNRIAVTGGTYDDWQKAAYGMVHYGKTEKPIYHGGLSSEVIFDEVVSSAATADEPLGSLGGRGSLKGTRGGHVVVKCDEECIIMVMVSLTPRLTYTQGNAWYMTELDSINDLHQPDFDRIGFQDLMTENLAWWDVQIDNGGNIERTSVGKQPAWLQYQTDINKAYGDFAEEDGKGFMVLSRLYDQDSVTGGVADVTTYIDPTKYNYPFAVNTLTAQNFWGFFNFDIKVRRLMSAKQMPNV